MSIKNNLQDYLRVRTAYDITNQNIKTKKVATHKDDYTTKIIKYIPGEIVTAYLFASGMIDGIDVNSTHTWLWGIFFFLLILTPFYRWRMIKLSELPWDRSAIIQALIATLAYTAWVFALGGPFEEWENWNTTIGALVLMGVTLILPLFDMLLLPAKKV